VAETGTSISPEQPSSVRATVSERKRFAKNAESLTVELLRVRDALTHTISQSEVRRSEGSSITTAAVGGGRFPRRLEAGGLAARKAALHFGARNDSVAGYREET
jgi:hypothetical protein